MNHSGIMGRGRDLSGQTVKKSFLLCILGSLFDIDEGTQRLDGKGKSS